MYAESQILAPKRAATSGRPLRVSPPTNRFSAERRRNASRKLTVAVVSRPMLAPMPIAVVSQMLASVVMPLVSASSRSLMTAPVPEMTLAARGAGCPPTYPGFQRHRHEQYGAARPT